MEERDGREAQDVEGKGLIPGWWHCWVEERLKDMSAQRKEKVDHVWMGSLTNWDQNNEGVGNKCTGIMKGMQRRKTE